ncbi:hypothetical protein N7454_007449 [Penicillium verhagenii]|nr:hypothetical protein N7454_007449 [Penicillium verhagenii]
MSPPSSKVKNGGNTSGPRQIRFVATDGQPQTKRRRVNAACLTCRRRKIRCSGEQPVCKTCSDYKHVCLGYGESTAHQRSQSDSVSRIPPALPVGSNDTKQRKERISGSYSPEPAPQVAPTPRPLSQQIPNKSPISKQSESKDASLSRDASARTNKESDSHAAGDTPGSKSLSPLRSPRPSDTPGGPSAVDSRDSRDANKIPFYDRDDTPPVSNLVSHLCDLFFMHLGCNFPFLQRERFLQDLKEKKVDTMLVDAVCALAARFSPHPLLGPPQAPPIDRSQPPADIRMWDRGLPFAHRAMSALVDSLPCPTLSVVQACLLLAYEEFGSNHDSGLWMYLGISIRMAQDLGLQKHQGLKYSYGRKGVTPSEVMTGQAGKLREDQYDDLDVYQSPKTQQAAFGAERAREKERVDTFWSIFFLDRVISSGTGRPVTLRDEDIELCFPLQSESQLPNGWPAPFPPLIRVIHLYGRVTDLINGIQDVNHVTPDTLKRLAGMESDLTGIYQRLSPKLHFNAANFQAYVKAKEGTNFILLHFWFHTLIVLLHQPTLLNSFGGSIQHLYPNSRELSMSSAKTIADILSFSELVDGKSFIGNPFTSQPMYIAACAFLMESAYYTSPSSRGTSPLPEPLLSSQSSGFVMPTMEPPHGSERNSTAKHILLASAAKENYQRCYKALKALNSYWEGTGYILTVLDQKAKGIVNPLLYTTEDVENIAGETPFGAATWRPGQAPDVAQNSQRPPGVADIPSDGRWSPKFDPGQAIGWALTGATNSSQPNLSLLYQMPNTEAETRSAKPTYSSQYSHSFPPLPVVTNAGASSSSSFAHPLIPAISHAESQASSLSTSNNKYSQVPSHTLGTESPYYMSINSPYAESGPGATASIQSNFNPGLSSSHLDGQTSAYGYPVSSRATDPHGSHGQLGSRNDLHPSMHTNNAGMMIGSHDVDMNTLHHQDSFPFANGEIVPWLEYLPQDVLSFFGENHNYPLMSPDDTTRPPP